MTNAIILPTRAEDAPDHLTPDPERLQMWLDALYSGKWEQSRGYLTIVASESPNMPVGSCCLGVGCDVAAIDSSKRETKPFSVLRYGAIGATQLAPREFVLWLFPDDAWVRYMVDEYAAAEFNLGIDWPEDLTLPKHVDDVTRSSSVFNVDAHDVNNLAALNDSGFTFPQIADIIRHFGFSRLIR